MVSHLSSSMNEEKVLENPHWNGEVLNPSKIPRKGFNDGQVNCAYQHDTTDTDSDASCHGDDIMRKSHHDDEEKGRTCGLGTHSIVLDISTTSFVDTVTVNTLKHVCVCYDICMWC